MTLNRTSDSGCRMRAGAANIRSVVSFAAMSAGRSPTAVAGGTYSGESLTDENRWPWLDGIATWIDTTRRAVNHGTVACSVLKRACRDILLVGNRRDVRIVYLKGDRDLIARRLAARDGHFMQLDSQFEALKETGLDECPIVVSIVPHPRKIVDLIVDKLGRATVPELTKVHPSGA
jgi:gluconokinase